MSSYGTVRYVENILETPESAEFFLRERSDDVVLERYEGYRYSEVIFEFKPNALIPENIRNTLKKARELIHSPKTIWVVREPRKK